MQQVRLVPYRTRVVSGATDRVLEIGIGSGPNLPFYGATVKHVTGIEPSLKLFNMARDAGGRSTKALELIEGTAEAIPIESARLIRS